MKKKFLIGLLWGALIVSVAVVLWARFYQKNTLTAEENLSAGINAAMMGQDKKAIVCLHRAAKGHKDVAAVANFYLGRLYLQQAQTRPAAAKLAQQYWEQAAVLRHPEACFNLALLYDAGTLLPQNRVQAFALMHRAARAGLPAASYVLGVWLERGYAGAFPVAKIVPLYERAAQQGYVPAMTSLVALYGGAGDESIIDFTKANYWLGQINSVSKTQNGH